ncbi:MAG: hypothetical protein JNJ39_14330 [Blastocatellia bacterium]|jgi:hypothetical protein|nr:hypothetical protein [Blastocatellia bacterium]
MNTNTIWLIEWSPTLQQFHIETLEGALTKNRRLFYNRIDLDWQPIAIVSDLDDAQPMIEHLDRKRREHLRSNADQTKGRQDRLRLGRRCRHRRRRDQQ